MLIYLQKTLHKILYSISKNPDGKANDCIHGKKEKEKISSLISALILICFKKGTRRPEGDGAHRPRKRRARARVLVNIDPALF